ncbi:hypothetical protein [Nocardioides convexus]|uniref:hypothetical protein n=1 Tax=Nocardioides convexus TaxID=2712224 RepID=UPI0024188349|nr:hypothetical protein [Nocardioides convexus]
MSTTTSTSPTVAPITRIRRRHRTRALVVVVVGAAICLGLLLVTFGLGAAGVPPGRSFPALLGVGDRFDLLVVRESGSRARRPPWSPASPSAWRARSSSPRCATTSPAPTSSASPVVPRWAR